MNSQGINVKPCYNLAHASTLYVYIYDEWVNFTFLMKTPREVLLEVFLRIKLNVLCYEKESFGRSTSQIFITVTKLYHFEKRYKVETSLMTHSISSPDTESSILFRF